MLHNTLKKYMVISKAQHTFAGNNTCHGSRKITAPGQVFAFYGVAVSSHLNMAAL